MKNKKWYIVTKFWIDEDNKHWRLCQYSELRNDCHVADSNCYTYTEQIDPDASDANDWVNKFTVTACPFYSTEKFAFTGNLGDCLRFIKLLKDRVNWRDWAWRNWKYEGIDVEIDDWEDEE